MERALDRLSRLQRVTAALSEALTPQQVAGAVVSHGIAALDAQAGRISLLQPDERSVEVMGFSGYTSVQSPFHLDEPLPTSEVLRTGKPVFIANNAEVLARFPRDREVAQPVVEGALASAPLIVEGRVQGAMTLAFSQDREFEPDDRELVIALARQCAQALERARLYALSLSVQADLRRSRDQLAAILGGIAEGVTVQDARGVLVYANEVAAKLSGYASVEGLLSDPGAPAQRFAMFDEAGEPLSVERLPGRRLLRGEPAEELEVQFRNLESGEWRWSIVDATPVNDANGQLQLVVNIFRDITERKRQTDATEFLAAASTVLGSTFDIESTLQRVAELAVRQIADRCGIDLVEGPGRTRRVAFAAVEPEAGPARSELSVKAVARGETVGVITLATSASGRRYDQVDVAIADDLARRAALAIDNARLFRETQEQLDHQAALNTALRETIEQRDQALLELQGVLRTRDEFLAWISHDLRSPLSSIKGTAQLLLRRIDRAGTSDVGRIRDGLRRLDLTASRAGGLVDELLDLARLQMGRPLELETEPTNLVGLASDAIAEYQQTTERHTLHLESSEPELIGTWDARRLGRVLSNLLDNAIKYSPSGGPIRVTVRREGARAVVAVADQGLGIPPHEHERIFGRFQRASNVAPRIGGSGLGLASSKHIVESHGGTIDVVSEEGSGATFIVRLPLSVQASDGEPATRPG